MTPATPACQPAGAHADAWRPASEVSVWQDGFSVRTLEAKTRFEAARPTLNRGTAIDDLLAVGENYSTAGWDGYDASPISWATIERALEFLAALPRSLPTPEIIPEATGTIAFEWQTSPSSVFSISIMDGYELAYAGLFGRGRTYGSEVFVDEFPRSFLAHLRRVYPEGTQI